jgi:tRNA nucleotidyltransferase (CCA-adding enzyme)
MQKMVRAGEVDALVPERVWQELARGLMEAQPSRMFEVLRNCGALARILPELDALWGVPQPEKFHPEIDTGVHVMMVIDYAAQQGYSLPIRCAALMHDLGKGSTPPSEWPRHYGHEGRSVALVEQVCKRLKIPNDCRDLARMTAREHGNVGRALELRPNTMVTLFERCDAFRKPQRFIDMLRASECDHRGRTGFADKPFPQAAWLGQALNAARAVDAGEVAQRYVDQPQRIPEAIHKARVDAVSRVVGPTTDRS